MAGLKRTSKRLEIAIDPSSLVQYVASAAEVPEGEESTWASVIENDCLRAAVQFIEEHAGISIWESTWVLYLDEWPEDGIIRLPRPPVTGITSISYIDSDGDEQSIDIDEDCYVSLSTSVPTIEHATSWPTAKQRPNAITITFTAGSYVDDTSPSEAAELDDDLRLALLQMYAHLLTVRGAAQEQRFAEIPFGVRDVIHRLKVNW